MKSPFKFLDAYTLDDKGIFFGRDAEIAELYDMVMKNRLMLVYGQSGTGKTSLVQCGLAARFDITDWMPVFVRRQNDLNAALDQRLRQILPASSGQNLNEHLENIYEQFLRPVYLVFDQLEELFILGSAAEQQQFIQSIRGVMDSTTPCRILFIIREEYLAHLYGFERVIPTLFDRRLRVEPMGIAKVHQVLSGTFKRYNIRVEAPADDTFTQIIDQVSAGKAGIQLPYLQVYLDMLYRDDYRRTYGERAPGDEWPALEFTRSEISQLGKIDDVLDDFLQDQRAIIQSELLQQKPGLDPDTVQKILDAFVSEEGTKRPLGFERKGERISVEQKWHHLFAGIPPDVLGTTFIRLEQARIIRFDDRHMELAHDALAALIDKRRSDAQRRLHETWTRLQASYWENQITGEYLSRKQLALLEESLPLFADRLDADVKKFIEKSEQHVRQTEQAELEAERKKRRNTRRVAIGGIALAIIAFAGFIYAWKAKLDMQGMALDIRISFAQTLKAEGKYNEALDQLYAARDMSAPLIVKKLPQMIDSWTLVRNYVTSGDSLARSGKLYEALEAYKKAQQTSSDARIDQQVEQTRKDIERQYHDAMLGGDALFTLGKYSDAANKYRRALELKPSDPEASQRLDASLKK